MVYIPHGVDCCCIALQQDIVLSLVQVEQDT